MQFIARAFSVLLIAAPVLTACSEPNTTARPIFSAQGVSPPEVRGVWASSEKGWILEIGETGIKRWQNTPTACYPSPAPDDATPLMGQIEYQLYRPTRDPKKTQFQYLPGDASATFEKLKHLPDQCVKDQTFSETDLFNILTSVFDAHFAFFTARKIDWASRVAVARQSVTDGMGEKALWSVFDQLISGIGDSHTKMVGLVDGEKRRIQGGLGETLPFIRSNGGEGPWIRALVDQLISDVLDPGAELIADRIVTGKIDDQIGYIQIFTMGGFTNIEPAGSIEWSKGELKELNRILDDLLTRYKDCDAIILDLSNNRGGYDAVARAIAARFSDTSFKGYRVEVPGHPEASTNYEIPPAKSIRYTGPVYLMTSDVTVSGGEITTMMMKQLPNVTLVGRPTRGSFSTPLAKPLPNGWYLELSNEVFMTPAGDVYEGRGIPPDIALDIYPQSAPVKGHAAVVEKTADLAKKRKG